MAIRILLADEFRGFARSKVMFALWIGLPLLSIVLRYIQPNIEEIPLLTFVSILVASIGGTLASVTLSTTVTSERARHVYDLFLVRPVRRQTLIIAKFLATFLCIAIAVLLSVVLGGAAEVLSGGSLRSLASFANLESLLVSLTGIAIACSVGILFGLLFNSVAISAILSAYLGNQITGIVILPLALVGSLNIVLYCAIVGIAVPAALLSLGMYVFSRKSL